MNKIIEEIKKIISDSIKEYLKDVKLSDLEENGTIYYMNGKNGTAFDWFVNNHLPSFMVFYNDKANLGAVKANVYTDSTLTLLLYKDKGKEVIKEVNTKINATLEELFLLAVTLENEADHKSIWDASIDKINTDINVSDIWIEEFNNVKEYLEPSIKRMDILNNKVALVSKKILEENYKVGYMYREEAHNDIDSGWTFMAGNEDDDYSNNPDNFRLVYVYTVYSLDPDIFNYIDKPVGAKFIRISSSKFEIDDKEKPIYVEKRNK